MDVAAIAIVDEGMDVGQVLLERLHGTKKMVGMGIFYSGAILHRFKEEGLWKGRASSWEAFTESEFTSYGFAMTAIRVYEKFVMQLQLPTPTIELLAQRDYTSLDKATTVVTEENIDEWIPKLTTLARKDIIAEIREIKGEPAVSQTIVDRLVVLYRAASPDERAEFHKRITGQGKQ